MGAGWWLLQPFGLLFPQVLKDNTPAARTATSKAITTQENFENLLCVLTALSSFPHESFPDDRGAGGRPGWGRLRRKRLRLNTPDECGAIHFELKPVSFEDSWTRPVLDPTKHFLWA